MCNANSHASFFSLDAVIKETMRIHSTSSLGLPRTVVGPGVNFGGHHFPMGTVLVSTSSTSYLP